MMNSKYIWQRPRLKTDAEQLLERKASWLELFFDLVFVIVIVVLSHTLAHDISWKGLATYVLIFIPVWLIWVNMAIFSDRFETADLSQRLFVFLMMIPVASMTLFINDGVDANSRGFAIAYILACLLLVAMWLRAGWHNEMARALTERYVAGLAAAVVLWSASIFVPVPGRYLFWTAGIIAELLSQLTAGSVLRKMPRYGAHHLPERFGLIVIIVLGDSIIDVIRGAAESENIAVAIGVAGVLGMALAFGFWWVYFDNVMASRVRDGFWWRVLWIYAHFLLVVSLTSTAAGIFNVMTLNQQQIPDAERWLICAAVAVSLMAIGIIEMSLDWEGWDSSTRIRHRLLRFGSAAAALAVGLLEVSFSADFVLLVLVLLVYLQEVPVFSSRMKLSASQ